MNALLNAYEPPKTQPYQELLPCSIVLVIDAFYWQRGDGVMLFRAVNLKRNLLWFLIKSETIADYLTGVNRLIEAGFNITGFVVDGRKGVVKALEKIAPVQYCQFHQKKTIRGYLTKNPKHEAAIELKAIADKLTTTDKLSLEANLQKWHIKWDDPLKERTEHPGGGWGYTHRRLRSAYFSLIHNLPWLFTCHNYPEIPNTTNSLDGSISHLRTLHRVHRGVQLRRRCNLTDTLLRGKTD
jgi:hypothetical protein